MENFEECGKKRSNYMEFREGRKEEMRDKKLFVEDESNFCETRDRSVVGKYTNDFRSRKVWRILLFGKNSLLRYERYDNLAGRNLCEELQHFNSASSRINLSKNSKRGLFLYP